MSIRSQVFGALMTLTVAVSVFSRSPVEGSESGWQSKSPEATIAEMSWLAGNWSGAMSGGVFQAHYSTPNGGKILSHSKLVMEKAEVFYEFELFEPRDDTVFLQPFPGGKKAGGFMLESHAVKERKAVFENPDKDFPTRIVYHRLSDDELVITLSDPHGGSDRVDRYELSR